MKYILTIVIIMSYAFSQAYTFETDEPNYSIDDPAFEYVIVWKKWNDTNSDWGWSGQESRPSYWSYHAKVFTNQTELLKWLNTGNDWYWFDEYRKRVRLNDKDILDAYSLRKSSKIDLRLNKTKRTRNDTTIVEVKEEKWTDKEYIIKE